MQIAQDMRNLQTCYTEVIELQKLNWSLNGNKIINYELIDYMGNRSSLHDAVNFPCVLLYFDSDMCQACVNKELINFKQFVEEAKIKDYIILTNGFKLRYLNKDRRFMRWRNRIFMVSNKYQQFFMGATPLISIVNEDGIIQSSYHASKNTNDIFENFLNYYKQQND